MLDHSSVAKLPTYSYEYRVLQLSDCTDTCLARSASKGDQTYKLPKHQYVRVDVYRRTGTGTDIFAAELQNNPTVPILHVAYASSTPVPGQNATGTGMAYATTTHSPRCPHSQKYSPHCWEPSGTASKTAEPRERNSSRLSCECHHANAIPHYPCVELGCPVPASMHACVLHAGRLVCVCTGRYRVPVCNTSPKFTTHAGLSPHS